MGFEPAEVVRNLSLLKDGGTVVCSASPVIPVSAMTGGPAYDVDAILEYLRKKVSRLVLLDMDKALQEAGSPRVMNVLLLGAASGCGALGIESAQLHRAIDERISEKLRELNHRAKPLKCGKKLPTMGQ